jgi:hypothetical protein
MKIRNILLLNQFLKNNSNFLKRFLELLKFLLKIKMILKKKNNNIYFKKLKKQTYKIIIIKSLSFM